jgi:hypothetical protein
MGRYQEGCPTWGLGSVATDRPEANAHPFRQRIGADRRRLPWRPLLVILGISAAVTTWYLFTVDAIKDEAGLLVLQGRQEGDQLP